jgi:histidine triad (HIT) family protein
MRSGPVASRPGKARHRRASWPMHGYHQHVSHPASPGASDCFICAKHSGELAPPGRAIYEDDLLYVGHSMSRDATSGTYLGWVVVETQRHVAGLENLSSVEAQAVGTTVVEMARALKVVVGADHVYAFVLGDHILHFHEHVVARYPGTPRQYWGVRADEWPDAPRGDEQAIAKLCDKLRHWLALTTALGT